MKSQSLADTATALFADNKGLLAMDESNPACNTRFASLGIHQTEETRRAYREMIVTTPELSECIGGAILYDETIRQHTRNLKPTMNCDPMAAVAAKILALHTCSRSTATSCPTRHFRLQVRESPSLSRKIYSSGIASGLRLTLIGTALNWVM